MATPRVDPALVPFLDALAELLVVAILKDEGERREVAGSPGEVVALHPSKSEPTSRRRARTARR